MNDILTDALAVIGVVLNGLPQGLLALAYGFASVPTALAGEWSHELGVGLTLIINEEGKLLGMPVNRLATDMAYLFNDVIVGNAILIGTTDEDFIGLTKEAAENIVEKWG